MLAGMDSVVAAAADGERALGSTLVSDAALLALWPSTDSGDEDLGEDAQVDAVIRTGSVTPTGEAEVREPAEEGGTADQDLIATGCASITERAFCQRLQCPIGPVLHLTDSEASWGENRSPWSQCGDNDEDDPPPHRSEEPHVQRRPEVSCQRCRWPILRPLAVNRCPLCYADIHTECLDRHFLADHDQSYEAWSAAAAAVRNAQFAPRRRLGDEPGMEVRTQEDDLWDGPGSRWEPIQTASDCYDDSKMADSRQLVGPVDPEPPSVQVAVCPAPEGEAGVVSNPKAPAGVHGPEVTTQDEATDLLDGPGSRWDRIETASDCYDVSKLKDCMPLEGPEGEGRPLPAGQDAALPALGEQAGEQRSCKRRKTCWNTSGWSDAKRQKFGAEGLICISMARTSFSSS